MWWVLFWEFNAWKKLGNRVGRRVYEKICLGILPWYEGKTCEETETRPLSPKIISSQKNLLVKLVNKKRNIYMGRPYIQYHLPKWQHHHQNPVQEEGEWSFLLVDGEEGRHHRLQISASWGVAMRRAILILTVLLPHNHKGDTENTIQSTQTYTKKNTGNGNKSEQLVFRFAWWHHRGHQWKGSKEYIQIIDFFCAHLFSI